MALVAHQTKGYSALTIKSQPCPRGVNLRCFVAFQLVGRTKKLASLKHQFHFRGQPIVLPKERSFKVSAFKSNGQNDEDDDTDRESKISKKPVPLSCLPHEREETLAASPDVTSNELSYASEGREGNELSYAAEDREGMAAGSQAIQKLFKKWLFMLRSQALSEPEGDIYTGRPVSGEISENREGFLRQKALNMLKATFVSFMGLDATIKFPLLIFVPWYFITRVAYGVEVAKELTPLWVIGPLIVAVYVKLIQGLCFLYISCFKQSIGFLQNVPTYYMLSYNYVAEGKLQAFLYARFCQPIVDVRSMDYKALARQKLKQLKERALEKYVDYVESIWPYYCRTIRFLKKANLL